MSLTLLALFTFYSKTEDYIVRIGGYNLSRANPNDDQNSIDSEISRIVVHQQFPNRKFNYDIALLKLKSSIASPSKKICLPNNDFENRATVTNFAVLAGWGLKTLGSCTSFKNLQIYRYCE